MFKAGHVLWGVYPIGENKERPFIVLVDEQPGERTPVVCTSTDLGLGSDPTTVLKGGCHPEIPKDSSVVYEKALFLDADALRVAINAGHYRFDSNTSLSPTDLADVQKGIDESDSTPRGIVDYAKKHGVV